MENYFKIFNIIVILIVIFPNAINSLICPNVFPYFGLRLSCVLKNRNQVNCFGSLAGVVKAHVQCENGYYNLQNVTQQTLLCNQDGKWSEEIIECIPKCVEPPNISELITNNNNFKSKAWYAEIIQKTQIDGQGNKIPAIILNENLILTLQNFFNISKYSDFIFTKEFANKFIIRIYYDDIKLSEHTINNMICYSEDDTNDSENLDRLEATDKLCIIKISHLEYIEFNENVKPICSNHKNFASVTKLIDFCRKSNRKNFVNECVVPPNNDPKVETVCFRENNEFATVYEKNKKNLIPTDCLEVSEYIARRCKIGYQYLNPNEDDYLSGCVKGSWKYEDNGCDLTCGEIHKNKTFTIPLIHRGKRNDIILTPWHVGVFANITTNDFEQICGGTIIDSNIILTAAHCFYDYPNARVHDASNYLIGAGKTYRNFYAVEKFAYFIGIKEIHIPKNYNPIGNVNDIAILLLKKHFKFSSHIKPICIDFNHYNDYSIKSGLTGNITGWGHTSDELQVSDTLLVTSLTSLTNDECKRTLHPNFMSDVLGDKFCGVNRKDNATACEGDSGGGFVIKKMVGYEERHYLIGIISSGIDYRKYCAAGFTTLFTNIQFYQPFIKDIISQSRTENLISLNNKIFKNDNNGCDITNIKSSIEEEDVCGIIDENSEPFQRPLIYKGKKTDITSAPWHVGIYRNFTGFFEHRCAGNIIHSNIVISTAHCVYNHQTYKFPLESELSNYLVGAGKNNPSYDAIEKNSYYVKVKEIHIPKDFSKDALINDISIIILDEHLKFSSYIRPVCVHFDNDYSIQDNLKGFTTGWGYTDAYDISGSDGLLVARFKTLTNEKCMHEAVVESWKKSPLAEGRAFITADKFCVIGENNATGCKGDGGAGFVVKKNFGSGERYYLYGVFSHSPLHCMDGDIPIFSNIQFNKNFIKDVIAKNRIENKIYDKIFHKIKEIFN